MEGNCEFRVDDLKIARLYQEIKKIVIIAGYKSEIDWQSGIKLSDISEEHFVRELAWVIVSSGLNEKVARKVFNRISPEFYHWKSIERIISNRSEKFQTAIKIFGNKNKIMAIIESIELVNQIGFEQIKEKLSNDPFETLMMFPYIGPITSYHLAKNIGLDIAKPDRHMTRIANLFGFSDVQNLCESISRFSGDCISVIDIVLWRFATLENNYLEILRYELNNMTNF